MKNNILKSVELIESNKVNQLIDNLNLYLKTHNQEDNSALISLISAIVGGLLVIIGQYAIECFKSKTENKKELSNIGLSGSENKIVKNLSGGMKRRVAIVRSILAKSDIILLDEPFKGLDAKTKCNTINYLKNKLKNKTAIIVTHDINEALDLGCKIINI